MKSIGVTVTVVAAIAYGLLLLHAFQGAKLRTQDDVMAFVSSISPLTSGIGWAFALGVFVWVGGVVEERLSEIRDRLIALKPKPAADIGISPSPRASAESILF